MTVIKSEYLRLKLDEYSKKKIEQAAAVIQSSLDNLIIATALEKAQEIIDQQEAMILTNRLRHLSLVNFLIPPPPNYLLLIILLIVFWH